MTEQRIVIDLTVDPKVLKAEVERILGHQLAMGGDAQ